MDTDATDRLCFNKNVNILAVWKIGEQDVYTEGTKMDAMELLTFLLNYQNGCQPRLVLSMSASARPTISILLLTACFCSL